MKTHILRLDAGATDCLKARSETGMTSNTAPLLVRTMQYVGTLLLVMMSMLGIAMAGDLPVDPGKDGKSSSDKGQIVVYIKWKQGSGQDKTTSTPVDIPAGKSPKEVANLIKDALGKNQAINSRFTFTTKADPFGGYDVSADPKTGYSEDGISTETAKDSTATGLSYGGKVALLGSPIDGWFAVAGSNGQPGDNFEIDLFGSSGKQTFSLPSYAGLTPSQIETGLAAEINLDSGYSASISSGVVYVSGAMDSFRVDFAPADSTQDFTLSAGAFVAPEPGTLSLLGSGILGLAGLLRKRLLT